MFLDSALSKNFPYGGSKIFFSYRPERLSTCLRKSKPHGCLTSGDLAPGGPGPLLGRSCGPFRLVLTASGPLLGPPPGPCSPGGPQTGPESYLELERGFAARESTYTYMSFCKNKKCLTAYEHTCFCLCVLAPVVSTCKERSIRSFTLLSSSPPSDSKNSGF